MDIRFCSRYEGTALPPTNRFCRTCPHAGIACNRLWALVVALAASRGGDAVPLPGTRAVMYPNHKSPDIVHLKITTKWGLPKEDFLHFIATGHAGMGRKGQRLDPASSPSMTRQEPYVQAIVKAIGGEGIPEIRAVRRVQEPTARSPGPKGLVLGAEVPDPEMVFREDLAGNAVALDRLLVRARGLPP